MLIAWFRTALCCSVALVSSRSFASTTLFPASNRGEEEIESIALLKVLRGETVIEIPAEDLSTTDIILSRLETNASRRRGGADIDRPTQAFAEYVSSHKGRGAAEELDAGRDLYGCEVCAGQFQGLGFRI